jgi:HAAS
VNETRHREVGEYLRRLQRLMSDVPDECRDEILSEIEEHINERLSELPSAGDAEVRNVLERLGDPGDIAADARERFGVKAPTPQKMSKGTRRIIVIAVALLVGIPLILVALGALTGVETSFEGPRRVITEQQFDGVRLGDDKSDVIGALGGQGERGSLVSGLVDFEGIRLEEHPPDVPRQQYNECWIYSVTGSGTGAQAGVCFVADEVVYKRIEKPE